MFTGQFIFLFLLTFIIRAGDVAPTPEPAVKTCDPAVEQALEAMNKVKSEETKIQQDVVARLQAPNVTDEEKAAGLQTLRASTAHVKQVLKDFRAAHPEEGECALSANPSEVLSSRNIDQSIRVVEEYERSL